MMKSRNQEEKIFYLYVNYTKISIQIYDIVPNM